MKTVKQRIGESIKKFRKAQKISQEEFGFKIGLTRSSIINLETGRSSTTLETFLNICQVLKCTPNDILPLDYKFTNPDVTEFKAIKLNAKSKRLQAQLAEVYRQQEEILKHKKVDPKSLEQVITL